MSELIIQSPLSLKAIFQKSFSFIFNNIIWLALLGSITSLPHFFITKDSSPLLFATILFIELILFTFYEGIITLVIGNQLFEIKMSWFEIIKKIMKKLVSLILLKIAIVLVVIFGTICFISPGFIALYATACATPALLFEDLSPTKAFEHSCYLTRGNRLRLFGYSFLALLILNIHLILLIILTSQLPLAFLENKFLIRLLFPLFTAPLLALYPAIITTLFFFDLRSQKQVIETVEQS